MKTSSPASGAALLPPACADTRRGPAASAACTSGSCCSGTVKRTSIGAIWLSMTSCVSFAFTTSPSWASRVPRRPAIGATMRVCSRSSSALRTAASPARSPPAATRACVPKVSRVCCEVAPCENSFAWRSVSTRLRSDWARSRARLAFACSSAASKGRGSIVKSGSPTFTSWPSTKWTFAIAPSIRGFTTTSATGVTMPMASSSIGTLRRSATAMRTGTGGGVGGPSEREQPCNAAALANRTASRRKPREQQPIAGVGIQTSGGGRPLPLVCRVGGESPRIGARPGITARAWPLARRPPATRSRGVRRRPLGLPMGRSRARSIGPDGTPRVGARRGRRFAWVQRTGISSRARGHRAARAGRHYRVLITPPPTRRGRLRRRWRGSNRARHPRCNADRESRHCAAFGTTLPSQRADRSRHCSQMVQCSRVRLRAVSRLGVGIALTPLAMSPVGFSLEVG